MSKLDVGVGDEFPLDEDKEDARSRHGHHHGRHHRHGGLGHDHFRRHHRGPRFHALPLLLIVGGVAALVVAGKISASAAYAMVGLGVLLLAVMIFAGVRHWRRFHQNRQGQA